MNYTIILPTLNENGHIIQLIKSIKKNFKNKKNKYEIILVDDNSIDGTVNTVKKYEKKDKKIRLFVRHNKKRNLAESLNLGILKAKYENLIWLDADFQHPPEYIKEMFKYSKKYDVIIFSRFLKKSIRYFDKNVNAKEANENQSIFFNKLCKFFFYKNITDYTSGYICISKKKLKNYKLKGYYGEYFLSLLIYCKKNNLAIIELPFKEKFRKTGFSKTIGESKLRYIFVCSNYFFSIIKNIFTKIFN
tara:strand:- start:1740 stop:2480 length:741 start_codon:yes stop_codon:yes gene_type:complete